MKAIKLIPGTTNVQCHEHEEPQIQTCNDVKVKVLEVGICGTDRELAAGGRASAPMGEKELILGHEMLGEVVEVGSAVTLFKKGDLAVITVRRSCKSCDFCKKGFPDFCVTENYLERGIKGLHGFQSTYVVDHEVFLVKVPQNLRSCGVLCEPMSVVEKAIDELLTIQKMRLPLWAKEDEYKNKQALVVGLGPIGLLACVILLLRGFKVYAQDIVAGEANRARILEEMGGTYIDGRQMKHQNIASKFGHMDLIVEATGVPFLGFAILQSLGTNGGAVFTGIPEPHGVIEVAGASLMNQIVLKNQVLLGSVNAAQKHWELAVKDLEAARHRWGNTIDKLITSHVPYHQFKELFANKHPDEIKVVITWQ